MTGGKEGGKERVSEVRICFYSGVKSIESYRKSYRIAKDLMLINSNTMLPHVIIRKVDEPTMK